MARAKPAIHQNRSPITPGSEPESWLEVQAAAMKLIADDENRASFFEDLNNVFFEYVSLLHAMKPGERGGADLGLDKKTARATWAAYQKGMEEAAEAIDGLPDVLAAELNTRLQQSTDAKLATELLWRINDGRLASELRALASCAKQVAESEHQRVSRPTLRAQFVQKVANLFKQFNATPNKNDLGSFCHLIGLSAGDPAAEREYLRALNAGNKTRSK